MMMKPEYYPKWLRELLFDPTVRLSAYLTNEPERNWKTLDRIRQLTYRTDPKDALIFDMCIEMERNKIKNEDRYDAITKELLLTRERLQKLEKGCKRGERKMPTVELTESTIKHLDNYRKETFANPELISYDYLIRGFLVDKIFKKGGK